MMPRLGLVVAGLVIHTDLVKRSYVRAYCVFCYFMLLRTPYILYIYNMCNLTHV